MWSWLTSLVYGATKAGLDTAIEQSEKPATLDTDTANRADIDSFDNALRDKLQSSPSKDD